MDKTQVEMVREIIFNENEMEALEKVKEVHDSKLLYALIDNYNWSNGFEIPRAVLANNFCDSGVALLTFYRADGYRLLEDKDVYKAHSISDWGGFIKDLYDRIKLADFKLSNVEFIPELTKVQKFKLKKVNPDLPPVFFDGTIGEKVNIIV